MDEIIYLTNNNQYYKAYEIMKELIDNGYGVSFDFAIRYINCLIRLKKSDEAANIACSIFPYVKDAKYRLSLAYPLFYLNKYDLLLDMFSSGLKYNSEKKLLADIYFYSGDIEKASEIYNDIIQNDDNDVASKSAKEKLLFIRNNRKFDAFLPINYESFIKKGNVLEPGHVVYLKNEITDEDSMESLPDPKRNSRPYMIYSVDGERLILFPVSTRPKSEDYRLFGQNYPNIGVDRKIKSALVFSYTNNVEKIIDKIKDNDFRVVMDNIFFDVYLNSHNKNKNEFLRKRTKDPIPGNMIKIVYRENNDFINKYYYIFDRNDKNYFGIEIDNRTYELKDNIRIFDNEEIPYRTIELSDELVTMINSSMKERELYNESMNNSNKNLSREFKK